MIDHHSSPGAKAAERALAAKRERTTLGPGVSGYTTSGAAYRGKEVAANRGIPGPAEQGFGHTDGLGYAKPKEASDLNDYPPIGGADAEER